MPLHHDLLTEQAGNQGAKGPIDGPFTLCEGCQAFICPLWLCLCLWAGCWLS